MPDPRAGEHLHQLVTGESRKPQTVRLAEGRLRLRLQVRESDRQYRLHQDAGSRQSLTDFDAILAAALVWLVLYGVVRHGRRTI